MADHQNKYEDYTVEDYFTEISDDAKVVRINLKCENGKKFPSSCQWFDYKVPSYSNSNKPNSLNIFNDKVYQTYLFQKDEIKDYNCLAIDTRHIYQLDFDDISDMDTINKLIQLGIPYFKSYSKGYHHFVFTDKNFNKPNLKYDFKSKNFEPYTNDNGQFINKSGELLKGQWSYCKPDALMYNIGLSFDNGEPIEFDLMNSDLINIIVTENKIESNNNMTNESDNSGNKLEEFSKCINIEKHINGEGCYSDWRNIIWALASVGEYELAKSISMLGKDKWDRVSFDKTYDSYTKEKGIGIGTFYHYCKEGNKDLYYELVDKYKKKMSVSLAVSHDDKASLIYDNYGDYFIYQDKLLYIWSDEHNKWRVDDEQKITREFICDVLKTNGNDELSNINKFTEEGSIRKAWKDLFMLILKNKQRPEINNIAGALIDKLATRNDNIKFDNNPYLLAFENTIYDFKNKLFRAHQKNDYITMTTKYNWEQPTQDQMNLIRELIKKIFANEEVRRCYMSILYNGCIGVCPEKFIIANGGGRNGKGVLNDLMREALGDYGYKGHSSTLIDKLKPGANPELANMNKRRFAVFTEPDIKHPINVATMKELTGGGSINARLNHSNITDTVLHAIVVCETNEKPKLDGSDANSTALKKRLRDVLFESSFSAETEEEVDEANKIFKEDTYYKSIEFQTLYRCSLLKYIMEYEGIDNLYTPECVAKRSEQYLLGNDIIYETVIDNTVESKGDFVKVSDLYDIFKDSDCFVNMNKSDKRKYNLKYFKEKIQLHTKFKKYYKEKYQYDKTAVRNILLGFRLLDQSDKDDEDDDTTPNN